MLSMVGGALKKINGVKDPNKLSHCHTKEKDPVLQYQPTPIHVLKAKSLGRGVEYDPVSNYSASSRVTLPLSTKRSHSSDAVVPTKRSKVVVDDDKIEAKFSDSEDDHIVDRTTVPASSTAHITDSNTSAKSSKASAGWDNLPSLSTNKQTPNLHLSDNTSNSPSKTSSTKLPVPASTIKSAATQFKPKHSSVHCLSSSQSQTNFTVISQCPAQLPSVPFKEDNCPAKRLSSDSKAVVHKDSNHTDKSHHSSSGSKSKLHHKNSSNTSSNGDNTSKTNDKHSRADGHHSSDATAKKQSNSDRHKHDRSSSQTKSSKDTCRKSEVASATHKHSAHKHNRSEQSDKKDATPSSHNSEQEEEKKEKDKLLSETSAHTPKTVGCESHVGEAALVDSKKHKTASAKESKHRHTPDAASGHHSQLEGGILAVTSQSKTNTSNVYSASHKDGKSSRHKSSKHRESTSATGSQHKQPVASSRMESSPSKTVTSNSIATADVKCVSAVRNIELFGEDSDTESDLMQSPPVPARVPVKQRQTVISKSSVSRHSSVSNDEVILLSDPSDSDDTFEQCQQLYNEFSRQQQSYPLTCSGTSTQNVSICV